MKPVSDQTMMYKVDEVEPKDAAETIVTVYQALKEKGYNPINQIVGYLLSGDPTYITSYRNARMLIRKFERDEILEELVGAYVKGK
ncbi:MAG: IreB family regulatory phosphoprotein [Sporomusaceae bacterium]|nr:IreB family regulatory phosphoprotein [Sporomusaceae bacterium]